LDDDHLPAVSFLKPKAHQDGHGDFSSPADEQNWLVNILNKIQLSPAYQRGEVAVLIAEDDSDGSYDHVLVTPEKRYSNNTLYGLGPRIIFLAISPYSKQNFIDSVLTDQTSIAKFIKYNWHLGDEPINAYSKENEAGSILNMFDFSETGKSLNPLLLYCDGSIYDGSTNTPPPVFQTANGMVAKGEGNLALYRNRRLTKNESFTNDANLPIKKIGYQTINGLYECANQFGY
jgi:phospholipase C